MARRWHRGQIGTPLAGLCLWSVSLFAQGPAQVNWTLAIDPAPAGGHTLARLTAKIDPGWHMYSMTTPAAIPTTVLARPNPSVEAMRAFQPPPKRAYDPNFQKDSETYEGNVEFLLDLQLAKSAVAGEFSVVARYQLCNDKMCIPPVRKTAAAALAIGAGTGNVTIPAGYAEVKPQAAAPSQGGPAQQESLAGFLLVAFGLGLASIFTPCVFPMIPIVMSFFLNRPSGSRAGSVVQAAVFCLGIVVLFSGLGLAATALLGPFGVVQLGSNPWVNGVIALIFLVFACSLLGAFEITLPSGLLTKLNHASDRGGYIGTLLMGLTFSLASFACVGPFVGTLLAASVSSGGVRPLAGMVVFATGLALPFFLLAIFPSYLKRLPRSGSWMARVKVVMAFIILAAMLYKLSAVDQVLQVNMLTRERFLAIWMVLFAMPGLYLLGFVSLEGIKRDEPVGLGRLFTGMAFLALAISLLPGMNGAKLGELDAFVPVAQSQPGQQAGSLQWMKNQFREALDRARREGKLVFVNFTGYACTNCHWMKANMLPRPEIAAAMKDFVLVELYTDGTDAQSEINQKLQLSALQTIAIPYYAIMDPDQNVVASFPGLTKDPAEFLAFLQKRPAKAAGLSFTGLNGNTIDLAGKPAVVNFWATWCVPCIQEIPSFNKVHAEFAPKGVAVLGLSMDEDGAPLVKKFLKDHPMEYPVALGNEKLGTQFNVAQLPVTLVFDKTGRIAQRFEGFTPEKNLRAAVEAVLR